MCCIPCLITTHILLTPYIYIYILSTHVSFTGYRKNTSHGIACPCTIKYYIHIYIYILPVISLNTLHVLPMNWTSGTTNTAHVAM